MVCILAAIVALGVGWVDASVPCEEAAFLTDKVVPTNACLESVNTGTRRIDDFVYIRVYVFHLRSGASLTCIQYISTVCQMGHNNRSTSRGSKSSIRVFS